MIGRRLTRRPVVAASYEVDQIEAIRLPHFAICSPEGTVAHDVRVPLDALDPKMDAIRTVVAYPCPRWGVARQDLSGCEHSAWTARPNGTSIHDAKSLKLAR
jgi:hypothetical protein